MIIWVVCEIEGPRLVEAFTTEEDAVGFLNWEVALCNLNQWYYTVRPVKLSIQK